jgi:hypothetical protein
MGAIHEGYVAVTPVHLDLTNHAALARLSEWGPALSAQMKGHDRRRR